jgi:murein DD-endopeptidase MepM/ murein hydrolase activator NlpD
MGGRSLGFARTGRWAGIRLRAGIITAVVAAVLLGNPGVGVAVDTSPAAVAARIDSLRKSLDRLGAQIEQADRDLAFASAAADRHRKTVASAAAELGRLGKDFAGHAAAMYTLGSSSTLETILGSTDVSDFVDKFSYLEQIHSQERGMLEQLVAIRKRAKMASTELALAVRDASIYQRQLQSRRGELLAKMREYQSLQNLLASLGGRGRLSRAPNGFHCPVAGPHYVSNNFGDPRPGGPHTGDDIQADYGEPAVAVLPATVVGTPRGGWIGIGVVIRDAIGNEWLYAHMEREYVSTGQRVYAGQLVGRVGCTGRCSGPHLHFEYHPHGGAPANPYRILSSAC